MAIILWSFAVIGIAVVRHNMINWSNNWGKIINEQRFSKELLNVVVMNVNLLRLPQQLLNMY